MPFVTPAGCFCVCSGERRGPERTDPGGGGFPAQGHTHGRGCGAAGSPTGGPFPSPGRGEFADRHRLGDPSVAPHPVTRPYTSGCFPGNSMQMDCPAPPPVSPSSTCSSPQRNPAEPNLLSSASSFLVLSAHSHLPWRLLLTPFSLLHHAHSSHPSSFFVSCSVLLCLAVTCGIDG